MSDQRAIHPAAQTGFERQAGAYERGRPAYPSEATDYLLSRLAIAPGTRVLDVGAGTGKFTRVLAAADADVLAVEPVDSMRREFSRRLPGVPVVAGSAEKIPVGGQTADAVVVAQAFHWFDGPRALTEIHRVLKPGGRLGMIWNVRDEETGWVAELTAIMNEHAGSVPRYRTGAWREPFEHTPLFTPLEYVAFTHVHEGSVDMVVDRMASISFIAALPPTEHADVLARTRALLATHPQTRGKERIAFPYRCDLFWCERK